MGGREEEQRVSESRSQRIFFASPRVWGVSDSSTEWSVEWKCVETSKWSLGDERREEPSGASSLPEGVVFASE